MREAWAILMRSENHLDGKQERLLGTTDCPCRTELFWTRKEAREYIEQHYGYRRNRPDLRAEPHGWKTPKAVRVTIHVSPV